jgi:hypothetical protein
MEREDPFRRREGGRPGGSTLCKRNRPGWQGNLDMNGRQSRFRMAQRSRQRAGIGSHATRLSAIPGQALRCRAAGMHPHRLGPQGGATSGSSADEERSQQQCRPLGESGWYVRRIPHGDLFFCMSPAIP